MLCFYRCHFQDASLFYSWSFRGKMVQGIKWYIWLNHFDMLGFLVCQWLLKVYFSRVTTDRLTACNLHLNSTFNMTNCQQYLNFWALPSLGTVTRRADKNIPVFKDIRSLPLFTNLSIQPALSNPLSKTHHVFNLIKNALMFSFYQLVSTQKAYSSGLFLYTTPLFKYKAL